MCFSVHSLSNLSPVWYSTPKNCSNNSTVHFPECAVAQFSWSRQFYSLVSIKNIKFKPTSLVTHCAINPFESYSNAANIKHLNMGPGSFRKHCCYHCAYGGHSLSHRCTRCFAYVTHLDRHDVSHTAHVPSHTRYNRPLSTVSLILLHRLSSNQ